MMRRVITLFLLVPLLACNSADKLGPTSFVVGGQWFFQEALLNATVPANCRDSGLITITQAGPRFTAAGTSSGSCTGPGGTQAFSDVPFDILNGEIDGTTIRFQVEGCPYTGTTAGAAPDSMGGTVSCTLPVGTTLVPMQGSWRAVPDTTAPVAPALRFSP